MSQNYKLKTKNSPRGFTLVEILLAMVILAMLSISILGMFQFALRVISENKARTGAIIIANEIQETIRNLPYNDVGTVGGLVAGVINQEEFVSLNKITYTVATGIVYVDDPFDGTVAGGTDQLGNDYKKVRVAVSWSGHFGTRDVVLVTSVAPRGIESNIGGGVLRITVIDADGDPVPNAPIHIMNDQTVPPIDDSSQLSDSNGVFLTSVPAANDSYYIGVTKNGYSNDYNCAIDPVGSGCSASEGNPAPVKPLATVLEGALTDLTFAIDRVATLNIRTVSQTNIPTEWIVNTDGTDEDQRNPSIAIDANGNFYFAWQDFRNSAARIYSQSYDGQTHTNLWSQDLAVTTANNQNGPDLTVAGDGNLYVAWFDDKNGNQDIYLNKYGLAGTDLWGGAKKLNTDSGSADQVYPQITSSSTAGVVWVAWKDSRAGGGDSDIYLQKIDANGNALWPNEIKVSFNSSQLYGANDTTSWAFDSPENYICDGGNCEGDTDVRVASGQAELVPIQACAGTATECSAVLSQTSCQNHQGCSWDAVGPCSGNSCQCPVLTTEPICEAAPTCDWQAGSEGCVGGGCDCWAISNRNRCQSVTGCSWFVWFCYKPSGSPGCSCSEITQQNTCSDANCGWEAAGGDCEGNCACDAITVDTACTNAGCGWDPAGPCEGTASACPTFSNRNSCEAQFGCLWSETGGGYPTEPQDIRPAQSLTVPDLIGWSSFTEEATKGSGQITYQLSNNDGGTWRYWDGSNWAVANDTQANTASEINTNISSFPVNKETLLFRALLDSNGSQQILLDTVTLGYSYTSSGGNFSQAVDLVTDETDAAYVVWETYTGTDLDVFFQKVNVDGGIVFSNDVRVNLASAGDQANSTIVSDGSAYLYISWQDSRNGIDEIYLQKYDRNGVAIWPADVRVSTYTGSAIQRNPAIAITQGGNIMLAWQDSRNGGNDIYAQAIDPTGNALWEDDIRINAETTGEQLNPDILIDQNGNLVVVWQDNRSGDFDIIAAAFNGDPSLSSPIPNVPIHIWGTKKVGANPVIYKFDQNLTTNGSGLLTIPNLEWDTYSIELGSGTSYTLLSAEPPLPVTLDPNQTLDVTLNLD